MAFTRVTRDYNCPVPLELYEQILWQVQKENMTFHFDEYQRQEAFVNSADSNEVPLLPMVYCNAFMSMKHGDVKLLRESLVQLKDHANDFINLAMEGNNNIGNGNEESLRKFGEDLMDLQKDIESMINYAERCIKISKEMLPIWLAIQEGGNKEETKPKKKTRRGGKKHKKNKNDT